jgi:hypothetical protein
MKAEYIPPLFSGVPAGIEAKGSYYLDGPGTAIAVLDSGAVSAYRPAWHTKPSRMLNRVQRQVHAMQGKYIPPAKTTQQGSAAASPTTYQQTLWPQRFEKANYIGDNYNQWYNDPACRKACNMYVYEAIRGGVKIRVGKNDYGDDPQQIADDYVKLWPVHGGPDDGVSLMGGGLCAMIAGEFWPQAAVSGQYIERFLNLPAVGMERRTDDADQFIDKREAYSQVDTQTWGDVGDPFPYWSVYNARWNWIPGSKNGNPEIISVRRIARLLELMESCKVTQVQVRSSMRYVYRYGTEENPATINQVKDLMALNGFVEVKREIFDPTEIARDVHMTGVGGVDVLEGDQNLGQVDHLKYFLDRYCNGLPTPRQLMSLGAENINRDTLKDIRAQWMSDTVRVNQFLGSSSAEPGPIGFFFNLQLLLAGIDPDLVPYEILWSKSTTETEQERIDSIIKLREAGGISQKTFLTMIQEYTKIPDIEQELKLLADEAEQATKMEERKRSAGQTMTDKRGKAK